MNKILSYLFISILLISCKEAVIGKNSSSISNLKGVDSVDTIDYIQIPLNPTSAISVQVLKDGKGLCNSGAFSQLPDNRDYFVGRMLINTSSDMCSGSNWQLALFKMDWTNNILNFQKLMVSPPVHIDSLGISIVTAYDPSVVKYNGEYWVAFECGGQGTILSTSVSACLAPFSIENGADLNRLTVPVKGSQVSNSTDVYSASVPKLLEFNGGLYLYWTAVHLKLINGENKFYNLATRGMQLVQEMSSSRKIWGVKSNNAPVASVDPLNSEVLGPNPNDNLSNNVADGFQVLAVNNKIIMTAAVGGSGCLTPVGPVFGCYRLQIYQSSLPLGEHVFNSEVLRSPQLAFNPQEYSRIFFNPNGESFMMGMMLPPALVGSTAPGNTIASGLKRYPFDTNNLSFSTDVTSINPKPNPPNRVEVVNMEISVLENFLTTCHATTTNTIDCRAAIKRYCINQGYVSGGYGPTDQSPDGFVNISCLNTSSTKLIITELTNLKKFQPKCNGLITDRCNSAINQYCVSVGYDAGGFGPGEFDGKNVAITCLKKLNANAVNTTFGKLQSYQKLCNDADVNSIACNSAANHFCNSLNYKSTYGILEHSGDLTVVGCMN